MPQHELRFLPRYRNPSSLVSFSERTEHRRAFMLVARDATSVLAAARRTSPSSSLPCFDLWRRTLRSGDTGPNGNTMKGLSVVLLVSMISLVGCASPAELFFRNSIVVDHLDGNYQRLARCTYEHLARQQHQLSVTDLREQETVRIALTNAPQTYWELSFVNEDDGRQTRLEVTSGSLPSEHVLALARACAA